MYPAGFDFPSRAPAEASLAEQMHFKPIFPVEAITTHVPQGAEATGGQHDGGGNVTVSSLLGTSDQVSLEKMDERGVAPLAQTLHPRSRLLVQSAPMGCLEGSSARFSGLCGGISSRHTSIRPHRLSMRNGGSKASSHPQGTTRLVLRLNATIGHKGARDWRMRDDEAFWRFGALALPKELPVSHIRKTRNRETRDEESRRPYPLQADFLKRSKPKRRR